MTDGTMTIALAIPHTPWVPRRVESMGDLRRQLGLSYVTEAGWARIGDGDAIDGPYREFTDRAPNNVWAEALWTWLYETEADFCLQLQDDTLLAPCFWPALRAMLSALPPDADVVGLTSVHPAAVDVAKRGHRWFRTPGNLVGWAWAIRREALGEFLEARAALPPSFRRKNEDEQMAEWAMRSGRGVWHPVPAIVDHRTDIESSYQNDAHSHRRPPVTWRTFDERELTDAIWWKPSGEPEMLAMPPQFECWFCGKNQVKVRAQTGAGICSECIVKCLSSSPASGTSCCFCGKPGGGVVSKDTGAIICAPCLRLASPRVGARFAKPGQPLIVIATPLKDKPHPAHADAICQLRAEETLNVEAPYEIAAWHQPSDDLTRVRSRIVRDVVALKRAGKPVTHLLMVDGDVVPTPLVVHRMLAARKPMVLAPYPLRVHNWQAADAVDPRTAEQKAMVYHIEMLPNPSHEIDETGCTEIGSMGLGCALIEVALLERMVDHYGKEPDRPDFAEIAHEAVERVKDEDGYLGTATLSAMLAEAYAAGRAAQSLVFDDVPFPGMASKETVALFALELSARRLWSEDKSFCRRVRAMGEKVWMYVGPGAPVDHFGETKFRGMLESLDIRALPEKAAP